MTITDETRRAFHRFDATVGPEYRAELVDGEIIVNPPPFKAHEYVFMRVNAQLTRKSAAEVGVSGNYGIATPNGNYIPDLAVIDDPDLVVDGEPWAPPTGVLMTIEITSSNADTDREEKRRAYAAADIQLYLLVDRKLRECTLFSEPDVERQDYRADVRVPFGSDLELPAPFSFTLTDFTPRTR